MEVLYPFLYKARICISLFKTNGCYLVSTQRPCFVYCPWTHLYICICL